MNTETGDRGDGRQPGRAFASFCERLFSDRFFVFDEGEPYFEERLLQAIWNEQLTTDAMTTAAGEELRVVHRGVWNVESGPDFRDATIYLGGRTLRGDVELHLRPEGWLQHGHQHDPAYANTILHVTWENPAGHRELPVGIPLCSLKGQLREPLAELIKRLDLTGYSYAQQVSPGATAAVLAGFDDGFLRDLLQSYGIARVLLKAQELGHAIGAHGLESAVYAQFLDIMGYKNNREAFAQLALAMPAPELAEAASAEETVALLLGAAGLLPDPTRDTVLPEHAALVRRLWQLWWARRTEYRAIAWNRHRLRPFNSPERRVVASALLLRRCRGQLGHHLVQAFVDLPGTAATLSRLDDLLALPDDTGWEPLYHFGRNLTHPANLLGEARRHDIIVNLAVPLFFAWCFLHNRPDLCPRGKAVLLALPKLQDNRPLKEAAHHLFVPPTRAHEVVTNACAQQGLLKLASDWSLA